VHRFSLNVEFFYNTCARIFDINFRSKLTSVICNESFFFLCENVVASTEPPSFISALESKGPSWQHKSLKGNWITKLRCPSKLKSSLLLENFNSRYQDTWYCILRSGEILLEKISIANSITNIQWKINCVKLRMEVHMVAKHTNIFSFCYIAYHALRYLLRHV